MDKQSMLVTYVLKSKEKISLILLTANGQGADMVLPLKRYDKATSDYVEDEEVVAKTTEKLAELGTTIEEVDSLIGTNIEVYYYEKNGKASLTPVMVFEKLTGQVAKALKRLGEVEVHYADNERFSRFEPYIEFQGKNYRISQLQDDQSSEEIVNVSLRYDGDSVKRVRQQLESQELPANQREVLEKALSDIVSKNKTSKMQDIENRFGFSIEEKIANNETTTAYVEVQSQSFGEEVKYFLIANTNVA